MANARRQRLSEPDSLRLVLVRAAWIAASALFGTAIVLSSGCSEDLTARVAELEKKQAESEEQHAALLKRLEASEISIGEHQVKLFEIELRAGEYSSATFDPSGDEGFARIDTDVGSFAVSLEDVQPLADGSRVRLHVGNLSAASISSGSVKVKWGQRLAAFAKKLEKKEWESYSAWQESLKEKTVELHGSLKSGYWNNVTVALPGTPPSELGYLEVSLETPRISLYLPDKSR